MQALLESPCLVGDLGPEVGRRRWLLLEELVRRRSDAGGRARTRLDCLGDPDAASQGVLVEVVRELEKQLWMVRAQLPNGHLP